MNTLLRPWALVVVASLLGCSAPGCGTQRSNTPAPVTATTTTSAPSANDSAMNPVAQAPANAPDDGEGGTQPAGPPPAGLAVATFAGGCFWCMEAAFEHLDGVRDAVSGYTGGSERHPTYDAVSNHRTSHAEAVRVLYDPNRVTYEQLLDLFWRRIDPTARDRAFADIGHQYRSVVFVHSPEQRAAAERSRAAIASSGRFEGPITTTIEDAPVFWVAEDYHQNFWHTSPERYNSYHENSGRREFLRAHWGPNAPY